MTEQEKYKEQFDPSQWERLIKLSEFKQAWDSGNLDKASLFSDRLAKGEPKMPVESKRKKPVDQML
jgi:hypothetical protein